MAIEKEIQYFDSKKAELIIQKEKEHLKLDPQQPVSGLAISGGGIRSASFGLGVLQSLVANDRLKEIDYLSTVSGGGYIGSALTWALKQDEDWFRPPGVLPGRNYKLF